MFDQSFIMAFHVFIRGLICKGFSPPDRLNVKWSSMFQPHWHSFLCFVSFFCISLQIFRFLPNVWFKCKIPQSVSDTGVFHLIRKSTTWWFSFELHVYNREFESVEQINTGKIEIHSSDFLNRNSEKKTRINRGPTWTLKVNCHQLFWSLNQNWSELCRGSCSVHWMANEAKAKRLAKEGMFYLSECFSQRYTTDSFLTVPFGLEQFRTNPSCNLFASQTLAKISFQWHKIRRGRSSPVKHSSGRKWRKVPIKGPYR